MTARKVHVVINPGAGRDEPLLKTLNRLFQLAGVEWDASITMKAGDARVQAEAAVARGADVVAVYGGDGTVGEVAGALVDTEVPLAILPGGTANVLSVELGIPRDVTQACALICAEALSTRRIDVGRVDGRHFFVRAGMGFEAAMIEGADAETRDRFGPLSYVVSGLRALRDPLLVRYYIELDSREFVECEGMSCILANAGALGTAALRLAPGIDVTDGLLDVIVMTTADLPSLIGLAARIITGAEQLDPVLHWQVKEVTVRSEPAQTLQIDGEAAGIVSVKAEVLPRRLQVIAPSYTTG